MWVGEILNEQSEKIRSLIEEGEIMIELIKDFCEETNRITKQLLPTNSYWKGVIDGRQDIVDKLLRFVEKKTKGMMIGSNKG